MELKYTSTRFELKEILDEKTFAIPNFQRGLSWKDNKKKMFIKTLLSGEPFGTILIYEDNEETYLIDGLQRITTIRDFYNNKYAYLTEDYIDDANIKSIIKNIKKIYKENNIKNEMLKARLDFAKAKNAILNKIKKSKGDFLLTLTEIKKYYKISDVQEKYFIDINKDLKAIINSIEKITNINNLKVYAIVYTGEKNRLPDIFYNLNTGGTAPSKYEVLASTWNNITYKINDPEIINIVFERYEGLKNSSQLKVTISKKELEKNGITLFEYCYSIGKILFSDKYNFTSFLGKSNDNIEPISFSIIALLTGLKENEANQIGKKLDKVNPKFLIELKRIIIDGFEKIYEGLEYWIVSERVTKKNPVNYNNVNSNYMIYHMFMSYIKKNYEIDIPNNEIKRIKKKSVENWNKGFIQNLHLHYFYDFISDYWTQHRQVKDLMENIKNPDLLDKYAYTISKDDWSKTLNTFIDEQAIYTGPNFNKKTKLFLEYLIKFKIKEDAKLKKDYFISKNKEPLSIEIEHIVPVNRIEERDLLKVIPVYSLGNACYLTSKVNEGKHEQTMYEYAKERPGYIVDERFTKFVNYPEEKELKFIQSLTSEFKVEYINFLKYRLNSLEEEFIKYMV